MESLTISDLKVELKKRGLKMSGNKSELIERLKENDDAPKESTTKPKQSKKPKKATIPKALRDAVWVRDIGKNYNGNCYVCQKEVDITSFECAHIIAEVNGGETTLSNLRITCKICNLSCGKNNLDDFKEKFVIENKAVNTAEIEFAKDYQYKYNLVSSNSKHETNSAPDIMRKTRQIIDCYPIFQQWYSNYEKMNKNEDKVKVINPGASHTFFFSIEKNIPVAINGYSFMRF